MDATSRCPRHSIERRENFLSLTRFQGGFKFGNSSLSHNQLQALDVHCAEDEICQRGIFADEFFPQHRVELGRRNFRVNPRQIHQRILNERVEQQVFQIGAALKKIPARSKNRQGAERLAQASLPAKSEILQRHRFCARANLCAVDNDR